MSDEPVDKEARKIIKQLVRYLGFEIDESYGFTMHAAVGGKLSDVEVEAWSLQRKIDALKVEVTQLESRLKFQNQSISDLVKKLTALTDHLGLLVLCNQTTVIKMKEDG